MNDLEGVCLSKYLSRGVFIFQKIHSFERNASKFTNTFQKNNQFLNLSISNFITEYTQIPVEQPNTNDSITICKEYFNDTRQYIQDRAQNEYVNLPTIYFVTPTYPRREQVPEIIRLGHTLMHVPKIHWIVADDVDQCNVHLDALLMEFGEIL